MSEKSEQERKEAELVQRMLKDADERAQRDQRNEDLSRNREHGGLDSFKKK